MNYEKKDLIVETEVDFVNKVAIVAYKVHLINYSKIPIPQNKITEKRFIRIIAFLNYHYGFDLSYSNFENLYQHPYDKDIFVSREYLDKIKVASNIKMEKVK